MSLHKGCHLTEDIINRAIYLLKTTEMTMPDIGKRLGVSKATIHKINKINNIRTYSVHNEYMIDGKCIQQK